MSREFRILMVIAGDVIVFMSLIVVASIGSGWCQRNLTPNVDLYITWFTLWMMPAFLYGSFRGVFDGVCLGGAVAMIVFIGSLQIGILCGVNQPIWLTAILFPVAIKIDRLVERMCPQELSGE